MVKKELFFFAFCWLFGFLNSKFDANDKKEVGTIVLKCEDQRQIVTKIPEESMRMFSSYGLQN